MEDLDLTGAIIALRLLAVVAYFTGATLALLIGGLAREGPNYHPALKLAALATGVPGLWIGLITVLRYLPGAHRPPVAALWLGNALVFGLAAVLQVGAIRLVIRGNRRWERGERCPVCYGSPPYMEGDDD